MTYGITSSGFVIKPLENVISDVSASIQANIDPGIDVGATSVIGNIIAPLSNEIADLWDVANAIYSAFDPAAASGVPLDNLCDLTGVVRLPATYSTVTGTARLTNGTTLPVNSQASVSGDTSTIFTTIEQIVNSSGITANFPVKMRAVVTGPQVANSGTLTVIQTPVSGWVSITNAADAILGTNIESDSALRLRRFEELTAQGKSTLEAVKADLLAVAAVTDVVVFENQTLVTDGNSTPGKAFQSVVLGGTNADVAAAILASGPLGIQPYGTTSVNVTDSQGIVHAIGFTRPTTIRLYCETTVLTDPALFPADGVTKIKAALAAKLSSMCRIGDDAIRTQLYSPIYTVPGILNVTVLKIDNVTPTVATGDFTVAAKSIAQLATGDITVTVT